MIRIRVQPHARRDEVVAERDGAIVVRLAAPPVEGRANEALRRLVADRAGVRRSAVEIVRGHGGRDKLVRVAGVGDAELRAALR